MSEELLRRISGVIVAGIEATGALIISVGAIWAAVRFVVDGLRHRSASVFVPIRLSLGRFLTLGLEFQLAADILRTAATPSFAQIGQLAAIATIRTALNFFLRREIAQEQRQQRDEREQQQRDEREQQREDRERRDPHRRHGQPHRSEPGRPDPQGPDRGP